MEMKIFVSAVNPNVSPKCEICYSMLSKQDEKADRWDVLPSGKNLLLHREGYYDTSLLTWFFAHARFH